MIRPLIVACLLLLTVQVVASGQTISVAGLVYDGRGKPIPGVRVNLYLGANPGIELAHDRTNKYGVYNIVCSKTILRVRKLAVGCEVPNPARPAIFNLTNVSNTVRRGKPEPLRALYATGLLDERSCAYGLAAIREEENLKVAFDIQSPADAQSKADSRSTVILARCRVYGFGEKNGEPRTVANNDQMLRRIALQSARLVDRDAYPDAQITYESLDRLRKTESFNKELARNARLDEEFRQLVLNNGALKPEHTSFFLGSDPATIDPAWAASRPIATSVGNYGKDRMVEVGGHPLMLVRGGGQHGRAGHEFPASPASPAWPGLVRDASGRTTHDGFRQLLNRSGAMRKFAIATKILENSNVPASVKSTIHDQIELDAPVIVVKPE